MSNILSASPFLGFCCVVLLFIVSLIVVLGVKVIILGIKQLYYKFNPPPKPQPKAARPKRKREPVKSIEIDPNEVDRIYVKKVS